MKTLLLIPSALKTGVKGLVAEDRHPTMDYYALTHGLARSTEGEPIHLLDYSAVDTARHPLVAVARRLAGRDVALALMGLLRRRQYDAIFTNGENVSIPLSLMLRAVGASKCGRRPGHVTIGHRLSTGKKQLFFKRLRADREMDAIFVYASTQERHGREALGIPAEKLCLIPFHADERFYRPQPEVVVNENQICAAGLEWRDYPTLIDAVRDMPDMKVKLAAASPWSKHRNETKDQTLPANVDARRYEYEALRHLYAESAFVVVPLYENDFQAGVTTLLEAMAMGKAVIVTRTTGQIDVVTDGVNGLTVAPGDVEGWKAAITRLRHDAELRDELGRNARRWVEENATLGRWVDHLVRALGESVRPGARSTAAQTGAVPDRGRSDGTRRGETRRAEQTT
jgi:glycosyltransferase involved in cell wall biosynthesis